MLLRLPKNVCLIGPSPDGNESEHLIPVERMMDFSDVFREKLLLDPVFEINLSDISTPEEFHAFVELIQEDSSGVMTDNQKREYVEQAIGLLFKTKSYKVINEVCR